MADTELSRSESSPARNAGEPQRSETDQILYAHNPDAYPRPRIDPKWRGLYERLLELRDNLIDEHTDLAQKAQEIQPSTEKLEPSENGTDTFHRDYALGMMSTAQELLTEVQAAIQRVEDGSYGVCEITGRPIPVERLDAVPWTRYSVEVQKQLEERGEAIKAGIGARGSADRRGAETPDGPRRDEEGSL